MKNKKKKKQQFFIAEKTTTILYRNHKITNNYTRERERERERVRDINHIWRRRRRKKTLKSQLKMKWLICKIIYFFKGTIFKKEKENT